MNLTNLLAPAVAIIGTGISASIAMVVAQAARRLTRELKQVDTTSQTLARWFSADMGVVRYEVLGIALKFTKQNDYSDVKWLLNTNFRQLPDSLPPISSGRQIAASQYLLILLYFFVELRVNLDLNRIDRVVLRDVFISQWEFWRPFLAELNEKYESEFRLQPGLARPPWLDMIPALDKYLSRR